MELRRLLFELGIKQASIIRVARDEGYRLDDGNLSRIVNGKRSASEQDRAGIRAALIALSVPKRDVDDVPELQA